MPDYAKWKQGKLSWKLRLGASVSDLSVENDSGDLSGAMAGYEDQAQVNEDGLNGNFQDRTDSEDGNNNDDGLIQH